jgi:hypothetical protein
LELFEVGRQQVTVTFDGGDIVSDAELLPIRQLDQELGILAEAARRLPDPRSQLLVVHSAERILTQQVYQILGGYPDGNDAQLLRHDPLFKTIAGVDPRETDRPLAGGSTLNRFQHAYTRREAQKPLEERDVMFEVRRAQLDRITGLNDFLVDMFVRTRKQRPARVIIDLDPTDDPTHGQQQLALFHGYYDQHQYFPMLIFEGDTGMPLGVWLRPGTLHAGCDAVDMLRRIVERVRAHWPEVATRATRTGLASPRSNEAHASNAPDPVPPVPRINVCAMTATRAEKKHQNWPRPPQPPASMTPPPIRFATMERCAMRVRLTASGVAVLKLILDRVWYCNRPASSTDEDIQNIHNGRDSLSQFLTLLADRRGKFG